MSDSEYSFPDETLNNTNKSISCFNIPKYFLDKSVAKNYFSKFGRISKFILNPKRLSCTVEYDSFNSAQNAVHNGGIFHDEDFDIAWTSKDVEERDTGFDLTDNITSKYGSDLLYDTMKRDTFAVPVSRGRPVTSKKRIEKDSVKMGLKQEYETIMNKPAFTSEEKYRVLDARDKLLRLSMSKLTDIQKATSTKGICPDMCPEKERLMREAKHQIASYELEMNSRDIMNHNVALKQYSRSSADQESPLAHELRPEPILQLTMNFLLHKIINQCDTQFINTSDWFHFVWDRTRSIRKDITQQELCSKDAVFLVEQCARFHIHCAARLVAEEPSVFDQKINTENLTKCLQSLKYMYHDLTLKNIKCKNEIEFRVYIILLNLNDSNFLWEIKQLTDDIKKSKEIRFAINVYLAIDTNNYVKFFNLVQETNYLNACILLRYFNQVRTKALYIIIKSYTLRTPINFSIKYLTHVLAFEDNDTTIQFLEYNGLQCDRNNDIVTLDKRYFFTPDIPFLLERALNIVEKKRTCSSSEIICGTTLPSIELVENYKPHNSFDKKGYLKIEAWDVRDQNYLKKNNAADIEEEIDDDEEDIVDDDDEDDELDEDDDDEVDDDEDFTRDNSPEMEFENIKKPLLANIFPPIEPKTTFNLPSFLVPNSKSPFDKIEAKMDSKNVNPFMQTAQKMEQFINPFKQMKTFKDNEIKTVINEDKTEIITVTDPSKTIQNIFFKPIIIDEVKKSAEEELKQTQKEIDNFLDKLIISVVDFETRKLVKNEIKRKIDNDKRILKEKTIIEEEFLYEFLADLIDDEILYRKYTIYRYVQRWRKKVKNIIQKRDKIENTPIWLPSVTIKERNLTLNNYYSPKINKLKLISQDLNSNKIQINIFDTISNQIRLVNKDKNKIFLKIICSIPDQHETNHFHFFINNWLKNIFIKKNNINSPYLFNEKLINNNKQIFICIRKIIGGNCLEENLKESYEILNNMNTLIFFVLPSETSRRRLHQIIYKADINLPIKLSIIVCNSTIEKEFLIDILELKCLIDDEKITEFNIEYCNIINNNCNDLINVTKNSLNYSLINFNNDFSLEMQNTIIFINNCLGDELWKRFEKVFDLNCFILEITNQINLVINLFNFTVDKVIQLINFNTNNYPTIPNEFNEFITTNNFDIPLSYEYFPDNWKSKIRYTKLKEFLNDLKLKKFRNDNYTTLGEFENELLYYLRDILKFSNSKKIYYEIIKLIRISFSYFDQHLNINQFIDKINKISWIGIIKIIANENIEKTYKIYKSTLPNEIIYNRNEFYIFINTTKWLTTEFSQFINDRNVEPLCKRKKMTL